MLTGFLNIDKPPGMTSHDVVVRVRRWLKRDLGSKKVGHAGTLDPMATGVLVLCVGQATRLSNYVMHVDKAYHAVLHLGIATDTYDAEGEIVAQQDATHITQDALEAVLPRFMGDIQQVPPIYSAIKKDGKKLYEMARAGEHVELEPRPVTIHAIEMIRWMPPKVVLNVHCGSGTYIRSLAHDIGAVLGVGAHLSALTRTHNGAFKLEDAHALEALEDDWQTHLIAPHQALTHYPALTLDDEQVQHIRHGRRIDRYSDDETVMAYLPNGHLLAILQARGDRWKPHKVFLPDD